MPAVAVANLVHRYASRTAIDGLTFSVEPGEIFALVGPNGGGKTTLFRVLSTLVPIQQGDAQILGFDLRHRVHQVRESIGVVFHSPGLDKKLTVIENLVHQRHLSGLTGKRLRQRAGEMLQRLGLVERADELVETLSGGLRRRVELAKGMLHCPRVLLLDEPSTGLDPGARGDLWSYLEEIRRAEGVTVVLTTHLLDEAERADRIAILNQGRLVALDTPERLRATVGGDTITIDTGDPEPLAAAIADRFGMPASVVDGSVRLELADAHQWIARLVEAFPGRFDAMTLGKPTLEDVFIARTGHRFWQPEEASHA